MRVVVIKCDRCKSTINEEDPIFKLKINEGKKRKEAELCGSCNELVVRVLDGANLAKPGRPARNESDLYQQQLESARRTANRALERYADGATADQLAGALRDVVSASHRPGDGS